MGKSEYSQGTLGNSVNSCEQTLERFAHAGIPGELVSPAFDTTGAGVGATAAHRGRLVPLAPPVGLGLKLNCVDVR
jgi:hypothetical protein